MPAKSKAQFRLMEAAAHGRSKKVPRDVAREYVEATGSPKGLPERKHPRQVGKFTVYGKRHG